ncbi:GNAT family N-acetyltransferase [Flavonifractor sp. An92]|uniref:GNAT family N-acetyltransferase n=1 Tax=Flavonifractor sp. An92 TaxID=1965666 RepID=UPI000B374750|nr:MULTISPECIES: GNAT family N-acetyltransferase [unclassified Flavonifractor]OUN07876.1 GNAT family N-acetyltransferase [Flavonifractor sp. An92]OUQ20634.1 GNAT family N-acetyltransferase [Flavonifractor sp. An135]
MEIRTAIPTDLEAVTAIEAACFPAEQAASRTDMAGRLAAYPDRFWLLLDGGAVIGFVNGMCTDEPDLRDEMYTDPTLHKETGEWQMIFGVDTVPSRRRQGCAARLLEYVIAVSRAEGRKGLVLTCREHLIHYYAKFGFSCEGVSQSVHGDVTWYQMRLTFEAC